MDFNEAFQPTGGTTGRSLVLFDEGGAKAGMQAVQEAVGVQVVPASGHESAPASGGGILFEALGVAVVDAPPDQVMQTTGNAAILAVEPERIVHALETRPYVPPKRNDTVAGGAPAATAGAGALITGVDESQATWGLQVTNVVNSRRSGADIRVAVLDTGFDLEHPDFAGRSVTAQSFIAGQEVQDGHGHGTHCIGTALGAKCPGVRPRYGVAHDAEIFAGKVLSNAGSGSDTGILAGIEWAIQNGCAVISMSLGAATRPGQPFSQVFERVAKRAQEQGTLIIAAAGNESRRPGIVNPVGHPANCPSIMAVAAMDVQGAVARFSNAGINPDGGQIDIAGPGVDVHSSWPLPTRYRRISGTSMATPHVAGIAALYAEADPAARGAALARALTGGAQRLELPSTDVGAGMVQAP